MLHDLVAGAPPRDRRQKWQTLRQCPEMDKMALSRCHFDSGMFDILLEMTKLATRNQLVIMKKILYIFLTAVVAVMAVSCKDRFKTSSSNTHDEPPVNVLFIDDLQKEVVSAIIDKVDLESNHYDILIYFDEAKNEWLRIQIDGDNHLGKTIDLAKTRDEDEQGWFWYLRYANAVINIFAKGAGPTCNGGTLYTSRLADDGDCPVLKIVLKDCQVAGHTLSMNFKRSLTLAESLS